MFCVVNPQSVVGNHIGLCCISWLRKKAFQKGKEGVKHAWRLLPSLAILGFCAGSQNQTRGSQTCGGMVMKFFSLEVSDNQNVTELIQKREKEKKRERKIVTSFLCSSTLYLVTFWIPYIYIHIYLYIYLYILFTIKNTMDLTDYLVSFCLSVSLVL